MAKVDSSSLMRRKKIKCGKFSASNLTLSHINNFISLHALDIIKSKSLQHGTSQTHKHSYSKNCCMLNIWSKWYKLFVKKIKIIGNTSIFFIFMLNGMTDTSKEKIKASDAMKFCFFKVCSHHQM